MSLRSTLQRVAATFLGTVLVLGTIPAATAADSSFADDLERVREALGIPGMAVAVVEDGEIVFARGFGLADVSAGTPAEASTPFGLASVTKPVAAVIIMQLVEEGAIDLDAPISDYGVNVDGSPAVTVRHLLTHSSGGTPGTEHSYDGNRYALLGGVIENATGNTFAAELSDRVLLPLGMTDTALNPINRWDSPAPPGFEEVARALGWGERFDHYPDVYRRLARPYQFDTDYSTIPGMYHLVHSPAAGLVSSVLDLAAFDIALDEGLLLSEASLDEMWTQEFEIRNGHPGCGYGLGWYVQEFEGRTIEWHTGRWPPSTSALYARFPDLGKTVIVLANTDNLTVPFNGLGNGDVMHSLPLLAFYRHFVYPELNGGPPPEVDWLGSADDIRLGLAAAEGETELEFLERELWAYRQALASSGEDRQADLLADLQRSALPGLGFRTDSLFTAVAGAPQVIDPVMSARSLTSLTMAILVWLGVAAVALIAAIALLAWKRPLRWFEWLLWPVAALAVGPISPVAYWLVRARSPDARWTRSLAASVIVVTGYAAAWVLTVSILLAAGDDPGPLVLVAAYLVPLIFGLLLIRAPLFAIAQGGYGRAARAGITGELISLHIGVGILMAISLIADNRVFSTVPHPASLYFLGMIGFASLAGLILQWPLHAWIASRGLDVWPAGAPGDVAVPRLRDSWWMTLTTLAVMIGLIGLAGALGG